MATTGLIDWRVSDSGELRPFVLLENGTDKEVGWAPQPGSQVEFLACLAFECLYEGTRGPGKTDALLMDFCQHVGQGWGAEWRGLLFRQTFPQLRDVITKSKKWFPMLFGPDNVKYNEGTHTWTWRSGEELRFSYGQKEDDYWNYHGFSWPWIAFEELTTWADLSFYKKMMSCCRSTVPGIPRKFRSTTNPYGPGHNVVKARFHLPIAPGRIVGPLIEGEKNERGDVLPERIAIHGHIRENRILMTADPEYISRIAAAARNKAELAAWIDGSWDIVAGGMFDDVWDPSHHVVPWFVVPKSWRVDRTFDWGSSKPFSVGWWAESDGTDLLLSNGSVRSTVRGDLFRIGEWYGWSGEPNEGVRMTAKDIARGIILREIEMGIHERCRPGPADASIFKRENGMCIASDLMQPVLIGGKYRRISFVSSNSAPGTRKAGWELMRNRLKNVTQKRRGPREFPGLFVGEKCEQFLRTVPVAPRDHRDLDDIDTETEDHIADEARYRVIASGGRVRSGRTVGLPS